MTKDELIEQLAEIVRAGHFEGKSDRAWRDIPESIREEYREDARQMWPLIVAFGAEWLENASPDDFATNISEPNIVSRVWREEMGDGGARDDGSRA